MPRVVFTSHLARHVSCPPPDVDALTLQTALESCFVEQPLLRDYILDERGHVRRHVIIFVDDQPISNRQEWDRALLPHSEVYVLQALSGG